MLKIFVLNMERSVERRNMMCDRLAGLPFEIEFLSAVDGKLLDDSSLPAGTEKRLAPGETGTYLSHIKAWKAVIDQQLDYAVILEDDVILEPCFSGVVNELCHLDFQWDAIRLSALMPIKGISLCSLAGGVALLLPNKNPSGCQGYLINKAGAKRMLTRLSIPTQPIDSAFDCYWKYSLCIPIVSPSVVYEDRSIVSTVSGRFGDIERSKPFYHLKRVIEAKCRKLRVYFMARVIVMRLHTN